MKRVNVDKIRINPLIFKKYLSMEFYDSKKEYPFLLNRTEIAEDSEYRYFFSPKTTLIKNLYKHYRGSTLTGGYEIYKKFGDRIVNELNKLEVYEVERGKSIQSVDGSSQKSMCTLWKYKINGKFNRILFAKALSADTEKYVINSTSEKIIISKRIAYKAKVGKNFITYYYSNNPNHPRVYSSFSFMKSNEKMRCLKKCGNDDYVAIDFNNSIIQAIAHKTESTTILELIKNGKFIENKDEKIKIISLVFSLFSNKFEVKKFRNDNKNDLETLLRGKGIPNDEVNNFLEYCSNGKHSSNDLFAFEKVLLDFAMEHCLPTCHDCIYIPTSKTDLIDAIIAALNALTISYKIETLDNDLIKRIS